MKDLSKIPDPKKHQHISFIKSGIRLLAAIFLIDQSFVIAGICFALAESLGIIEELV